MTASTATPCPLWRRLAALAYDLLVLLAIAMVVSLLCQLATHGRLVAAGPAPRAAWWYPPLQGAVIAAYFLASWRRGGQTLGMRPWHIRVLAADGARPSWRQALLRLAVAALPLLGLELAPWLGARAALCAVAAAWAAWFGLGLFDPRRRALHDLLAGTGVYRIEAPAAATPRPGRRTASP